MENTDKPAFPSMVPDGDQKKDGLTKREYFAAMAMQGFLAANSECFQSSAIPLPVTSEVAKWAVLAADALLLELEKTK